QTSRTPEAARRRMSLYIPRKGGHPPLKVLVQERPLVSQNLLPRRPLLVCSQATESRHELQLEADVVIRFVREVPGQQAVFPVGPPDLQGGLLEEEPLLRQVGRLPRRRG